MKAMILSEKTLDSCLDSAFYLGGMFALDTAMESSTALRKQERMAQAREEIKTLLIQHGVEIINLKNQ